MAGTKRNATLHSDRLNEGIWIQAVVNFFFRFWSKLCYLS